MISLLTLALLTLTAAAALLVRAFGPTNPTEATATSPDRSPVGTEVPREGCLHENGLNVCAYGEANLRDAYLRHRELLGEPLTSFDSRGQTFRFGRLTYAPGNPPGEALTARLESAPFLIDNTPPRITGLGATRNGGKLTVKWHAADALNIIEKAEYSLDGGDWTVVAPVTRISDSLELDYELSLDVGPGEHTVAVRVTDEYDNVGTETARPSAVATAASATRWRPARCAKRRARLITWLVGRGRGRGRRTCRPRWVEAHTRAIRRRG